MWGDSFLESDYQICISSPPFKSFYPVCMSTPFVFTFSPVASVVAALQHTLCLQHIVFSDQFAMHYTACHKAFTFTGLNSRCTTDIGVWPGTYW